MAGSSDKEIDALIGRETNTRLLVRRVAEALVGKSGQGGQGGRGKARRSLVVYERILV